MTNHPNRSKRRASYAILLNANTLWKSLGAADAAIFGRSEDAQATIDEFSGRGALAKPIIVRIVSGATEGARLVSGHYAI